MSRKRTPIQRAIEIAGGLTALGNAIGVSAQAVSRWKINNCVPLDRVIAVEQVTGVPREQLRPDVFSAPRPPIRATNAAA